MSDVIQIPLKVETASQKVTRPQTSFNRDTHQAPVFKADGKEVMNKQSPYLAQCQSSNILGSDIMIPNHWAKNQTKDASMGSRMTQRKLFLQRRQANRPHPSYDLDGDGHVSHTDLFLAKRFDKDKDDKLNEEELATAKDALSKGYKDQFMFGLDRSGVVQSALQVNLNLTAKKIAPMKAKEQVDKQKSQHKKQSSIRVLQRDGKILVGEDFTPLVDNLKNTLFKQRSASAFGCRTKTELRQRRKQESVDVLAHAYGDLQEPKLRATKPTYARPQSVQAVVRPRKEDGKQQHPLTLVQRLEQKERAELRTKMGMNNQPSDVSFKIKVIDDTDSKRVTCKTTKQLQEMRTGIDIEMIKQRTIQGQLDRIAKNKVRDAADRVRVAELAVEKQITSEQKAKTRSQLVQQRKERECVQNAKTFGAFKYGIHGGKTIPNFYSAASTTTAKDDSQREAQTTIEWYKVRRDQTQTNPVTTSQRQLLSQVKYWAKPDQLYLNEMNAESAKPDLFKENRVINLTKQLELKQSCAKPNSFPAPIVEETAKKMAKGPIKRKLQTRFSSEVLYYRGSLKSSNTLFQRGDAPKAAYVEANSQINKQSVNTSQGSIALQKRRDANKPPTGLNTKQIVTGGLMRHKTLTKDLDVSEMISRNNSLGGQQTQHGNTSVHSGHNEIFNQQSKSVQNSAIVEVHDQEVANNEHSALGSMNGPSMFVRVKDSLGHKEGLDLGPLGGHASTQASLTRNPNASLAPIQAHTNAQTGLSSLAAPINTSSFVTAESINVRKTALLGVRSAGFFAMQRGSEAKSTKVRPSSNMAFRKASESRNDKL